MRVPSDAAKATFSLSGGSGDGDMYVRYGQKPTLTEYDCRPYKSGNNETCLILSARPGKYYVMINGYRPYSGATLIGDVFADSDRVIYNNDTDFAIADNATIESLILVDNHPGTGSTESLVNVEITHTYIADLTVSLISPDGMEYVLHNRSGGSADDISATYTVDLSGKPASGIWKLRVKDHSQGDTGILTKWRLSL